MARVPARYIGTHPVRLHEGSRPLDAEGKPRSLILSSGDTLQISATELYGYTQKYTSRTHAALLWQKTGQVVLPEDAERSDEELAVLGYVFSLGRSDFEPLDGSDATVRKVEEAPLEPEEPVRDEDVDQLAAQLKGE